jgi:hypothetical protein
LPPESGREFQGPGLDSLESPLHPRSLFRTHVGPGKVAADICEEAISEGHFHRSLTPRTDDAQSTPAGRGECVQAPAPEVAGRPDASTPSRPPGERRPRRSRLLGGGSPRSTRPRCPPARADLPRPAVTHGELARTRTTPRTAGKTPPEADAEPGEAPGASRKVLTDRPAAPRSPRPRPASRPGGRAQFVSDSPGTLPGTLPRTRRGRLRRRERRVRPCFGRARATPPPRSGKRRPRARPPSRVPPAATAPGKADGVRPRPTARGPPPP